MTANESRQDLIDWMNNLLQLNMTKVEQCGTGAAFCQIFDSIYLDVDMHNVKFNVNTEYAYLNNFKVLQKTFMKHNVDKKFDSGVLVKCRMQDNLHLLQWCKKFWDEHYPGGEYDAVARRKGGGMPPSTSRRPATTGSRRGGTTPTAGARVPRVGGGAASSALQQENNTLKETVVGLERERDFYFSKLRDIELLVQQAVEEDPELEKAEDGLVKQIQNILYSTEEGFEIPEGEGLDDQETF